jgi:dihydroorotate dehydrogenase
VSQYITLLCLIGSASLVGAMLTSLVGACADVYCGFVSLYARVMKPALFALDAERAHELILTTLSHPLVCQALAAQRHIPRDRQLQQQILGLSFDHPIGLAAGLDKQGTAAAAWAALGFSFAEIGTVTPRPQPGNPRPRLFRLRDDRAIINRFGFNSVGTEGVARNLVAGAPPGMRVGINLGKNKDTPNEHAASDYTSVVDVLHPFADYFAINVSSPNTSGLRDLQQGRALRTLVGEVVTRVGAVARKKIPVLVKLSPDMADADLVDSATAALEAGAAGIIATNTTVTRENLRTNGSLVQQTGGLSGAPLRAVSTRACRVLYKQFGRQVPIVGVGGIFTPGDAYERIRAGASLVQLYTALVYEGPGLVSRILRGLLDLSTRDGFSNIGEAVGVDVK